jgi:elongation factor G
MKQYPTDQIRNIVLLSHGGAGKTSLAEAILFTAGVVNRLGKVEAGTTASDYDPDEIKRHISLNLSLVPYPWLENKINLFDVPGYPDFIGEVKSAVRVCEGSIILASAASGVEVGTEQTWQYSQRGGLSRLIFINKMDRENANFARVVDQFQAKYGKKCLPLQIPIGAHTEFKGVIDLLVMKAYTGAPQQEGEIPEALREEAAARRSQMIETIAEMDDTLMEKYLGGEELSNEELLRGLKQAVSDGTIVPILTGSALLDIGIEKLMDAISNYMPSPAQRKIAVAEDSPTRAEDLGEAFAALVFKTSADPYVGKLTLFRVYSGAIDSNSQIWNINHSSQERVGQLFTIHGKQQEPVAKIIAGDIGAVAKLSVTTTGDTLTTQEKPVKLSPIVFPSPIYSVAVHPKTKADLDKMGGALTRLTEEDPTLLVRRDHETAETILAGMGDTQLDVAAEKIQRKFGVGVELKPPRVPYRETITHPVKAEFKHKKQTGGHGQYGHVLLELVPLPRGSENLFENKVVGGTIPKNYIPAVEKGVIEGYKEGILAGYPVVDLKVVVYDGSYHPVDSSEICFKIAASQALKKGLNEGNPILLEPIMKLQIVVPNEFTGDILSDLNTKRARVHGMNPEDDYNTIEAEVSMGEITRYAIDLKSITQGRGTFTMEFSHYEEVPAFNTQKIIAERQAEKEQSEK